MYTLVFEAKVTISNKEYNKMIIGVGTEKGPKIVYDTKKPLFFISGKGVKLTQAIARKGFV